MIATRQSPGKAIQPAAAARQLEVAILGAGFGGIGMAIRLRQTGLAKFTIYEKADGVGGTWRDNTYPGAACDVPSHFYSFSFDTRHDWPQRFSTQAVILDYLEDLVARHELKPHLRLGTEIVEMRFDEGEGRWHLRSAAGETFMADVVVSGLGQLNRPWIPDIAGLESFSGTMFHSARWNHDHDLRGKRVAVIGTGASAIQFVPPVSEQAAHLTVFQKSANWILPKRDRHYSDRAKKLFNRVPALDRAYRALIWASFESRWFAMRDKSRLGALIAKASRAHLEAQISDPELRRKLTPDYPVGCQRILISDDYYPAIAKPHVELVTDPVERIEPDAVVAADGKRYEVDTIIFGTGFATTEFLAPIDIAGRGGRRLHDDWRNGAEAYLGMAVSGYPNLFLLYGPNTNLGHNSIIFMLECQIRWILQQIRTIRDEGLAWVDVLPSAQSEFNRKVEEMMAGSVWKAGCRSWYKTESGKVTNNWPGFTARYWLDTRKPDRAAFERRATTTAR